MKISVIKSSTKSYYSESEKNNIYKIYEQIFRKKTIMKILVSNKFNE